MPNLNLSFEVRLEGADQLNRTLKNALQGLNEAPKAAQGGLEQLNKGFQDILKNVAHLNGVMAASKGDKSWVEKMIGPAQAYLVKDLEKSIRDLGKEADNLMAKAERAETRARQAERMGHAASARRFRLVQAGAAAGAEAAGEAQETAREQLDRVTGKGLGRDVANSIKEAFSPSSIKQAFGEAMKSAGFGGLMGLAGPTAVVGGALWAGKAYLEGGARGDIARQAFRYAAADEALRGDYTRATIRDLGLSNAAGIQAVQERTGSMLAGLTTATDRSSWLENVYGTLYTGISGIKNFSFEAGNFNYLKSREDLAAAQFQRVGDVSQYREQMGLQLADIETGIGGRRNLPALLAGLQSGAFGTRLTREQTVRTLTGLSRFGMRAVGGASEGQLGLLGERFGVSDAMLEQLFQRVGVMSRTTTSGVAGGEANVVSLMQRFFSAAGLGGQAPGTMEARRVLSEGLGASLQTSGALGGADVDAQSQVLASMNAAAASTAARHGIAAPQAAGMAVAAQRQLSGELQSQMDPRRMMVMSALVRMGFSGADAQRILYRGVENVDMAALSRFATKRFGHRVNVGREIDKAIGGINEAFTTSLDVNVTPGLDRVLGGSVSAAMVAGVRNPAAGEAMLNAQRNAFEGRHSLRNAIPAQDAGETTQQQVNQVRAQADAAIAKSLNRLSAVIDAAFAKSVEAMPEEMSRLTDALVKAAGNRLPPAPSSRSSSHGVGGSTEPGKLLDALRHHHGH
jgi:hypothetical protein